MTPLTLQLWHSNDIFPIKDFKVMLKIPIPIYLISHIKNAFKTKYKAKLSASVLLQLVDTQKCCREIAASKTATEVTSRPVARETSCAV